jgi:hypothetical protein
MQFRNAVEESNAKLEATVVASVNKSRAASAAEVNALPEALPLSEAELRIHRRAIRSSHRYPVPTEREMRMTTDRLRAVGMTDDQIAAAIFNSSSSGKPLAQIQAGPRGGIGVGVRELPDNVQVDAKVKRNVRVRYTGNGRIEVDPAECSDMDREALIRMLESAGYRVIAEENGMPVFEDPMYAPRSAQMTQLQRKSDGSVVAYAPPVRIR